MAKRKRKSTKKIKSEQMTSKDVKTVDIKSPESVTKNEDEDKFTKAKFNKWANSGEWKHTKNWNNVSPSQFVLRSQSGDDRLFMRVVDYIRGNGVVRYFQRMSYKYYDHDGYQYWTTGFDVKRVTVINRSELPKKNDRKTKTQS